VLEVEKELTAAAVVHDKVAEGACEATTHRQGPNSETVINAQFFWGLESEAKIDDEGVRYLLQRVPLTFCVIGLSAR
jgi:hypothetical protein